ncbi:unnamed protein product [Moneuplotes crassus]|uniref:Uncharacterized protein n=1 Tax=Euplotes crassus TaxID=5936 RepID=A0AAD1UG33_EUPCR|nr:unnamed protein product [Moneuplotes crassus]
MAQNSIPPSKPSIIDPITGNYMLNCRMAGRYVAKDRFWREGVDRKINSGSKRNENGVWRSRSVKSVQRGYNDHFLPNMDYSNDGTISVAGKPSRKMDMYSRFKMFHSRSKNNSISNELATPSEYNNQERSLATHDIKGASPSKKNFDKNIFIDRGSIKEVFGQKPGNYQGYKADRNNGGTFNPYPANKMFVDDLNSYAKHKLKNKQNDMKRQDNLRLLESRSQDGRNISALGTNRASFQNQNMRIIDRGIFPPQDVSKTIKDIKERHNSDERDGSDKRFELNRTENTNDFKRAIPKQQTTKMPLLKLKNIKKINPIGLKIPKNLYQRSSTVPPLSTPLGPITHLAPHHHLYSLFPPLSPTNPPKRPNLQKYNSFRSPAQFLRFKP